MRSSDCFLGAEKAPPGRGAARDRLRLGALADLLRPREREAARVPDVLSSVRSRLSRSCRLRRSSMADATWRTALGTMSTEFYFSQPPFGLSAMIKPYHVNQNDRQLDVDKLTALVSLAVCRALTILLPMSHSERHIQEKSDLKVLACTRVSSRSRRPRRSYHT